jgi:glycosyltransferase involved in cell wall biosynthesis
MNMSSKIVVDGAFYQIGRSGIARVWNKLLAHWVKTGFASQVVVLDRNNTCQRVEGVRYRTVPPFAYNNMDEDRRMLQAVCNDEQADLFISTYYTYPTSTPSAMLIYDMIPEMLGWDLSQPMWQQKQAAMQYGKFYAAISENSAKDLRKHLNRPELKVDIAYTGTDFVPATPAAIDSFKTRHGIHKPYFLISGSRGDYKNVALFFKAFETLGDERAHYSIVCTGGGQIEAEFAAQAGPADVHVVILDDNDMQAAYSGAVSLVYPSLYEGFGLPVLEAMACDCPVITTDQSSIPEVGGNVPLYIQIGPDKAQHVRQLAEHLHTIQDPAVRQRMIEAGRVQATKFRWDTMGDIMQRYLSEAAQACQDAKTRACRLCGAPSHGIFTKRLLHKYDVQFNLCDTCGATQTEKPYWLDEAYVPENEMFDTGQVTRSLINAAVLNTLLPMCGLGGPGNGPRIVDYGCGSGLLVRSLRDIGWDAWGYDRYSQPRLALGFQSPTFKHFDVINLCEVVEHFDEPRAYFDAIFETNPKVVLIQTGIASQVTPDWDYISSEHGQHIFFMSPKTLGWLCQTYGRVAVNVLGFQVLVTPDIAERLLDPATDGLKVEHQAAINNVLINLWQGMFAKPYFHAGQDNQLLRDRANA